MKKIKVLLIVMMVALVAVSVTMGVKNLFDSTTDSVVVDAPAEDTNTSLKKPAAATQSEIASYGITFGTFAQFDTSRGVYVNNAPDDASAVSYTNIPAIGIKGRYFIYYYAKWMAGSSTAESIDNVTNYVGTGQLVGFPPARISAPRSVSELYWDDQGRLYFNGYLSQYSSKPIYITSSGLTISTTDSTIIAKTPATINVTAPSGGGSVSGGGTTYVDNVITLRAVAATGYTFAGWYTNSSLSGTPLSTSANYSYKVTGNANFYAKFTINSYTITARSNNTSYGSVSGGGTYTYGSSVVLTATPVKGYRLVSWSNSATTSATVVQVGATNATYTATFAAITYQVNYQGLENATCSSRPTSATYNVAFNVSNPTKTGYTFTGWTVTGYDNTTAQNGTSTASFTSLSTVNNKYTYFRNLTATNGEAVTFTANWQINSYSLTAYSSNTAWGSVSGGGTYNFGAQRTLVATPKTGYAFAGWYTNSACTGTATSTSNNLVVTMPAGNLTYYAKFVQQGIHVKSTYTNTSLSGREFNNLNTALEAAIYQNVSVIYIDGPIGSLYANTNTFVNRIGNYIKYNGTGSISIIGMNSSSAIYNNAANTLIDVQNGSITFKDVQIIGSGASKTSGNRDNALLRVSGGQLVLDSGAVVKNSYNIGSGIHYVGDWCPGAIDVAGGTLVINDGATLTGNTTTWGGDIFVHGGSLVMNGGTISNSVETGIYVYSGSIELNNSANPGSVYIGKNVLLDVNNLSNNIYVYAENRMSAGAIFGTASSEATANKIITEIQDNGSYKYSYQGTLSGSSNLAWKEVRVVVPKTALQLAIENASGKYTITQGEAINLATALGKYVKHVSGCLSVGTVRITSGSAITTGSGKRTTITGSEVGTVQVTLYNVSTYRCYYYGTTKISEVSITIQVLPKIGEVVESNTSIAVVDCDKDCTYTLKDTNGNVVSTLTPSLDSLTGDYYVRFEYLTANTDYVLEVSKTVSGKKYTNTTEITTASETALVKAIRNASGFYMNVGENTTLSNIIGRYVRHLTYCINIADVKTIASSANNVVTITGSGKNVRIVSNTPGYVDISMQVKTNGWCAVYGTISNAQEVTIRIYVLPTINSSAVTLGSNSISLPTLGSGYYYSIDGGTNWISATNSPVFNNLTPNTKYDVIVGYTMSGETKPSACQNTYQFTTKALPTYASLQEKAEQLIAELENKNLSLETKQNAQEVIDKIINGQSEYSSSTEQLLDDIYKYLEEVDALSTTSEESIVANEAADKLFVELNNKNVSEINQTLASNQDLVSKTEETVDKINNATTHESTLEIIKEISSLSTLEKDALTNNTQNDYFATLKENYIKTAISELEKITNIPDLMETYRAQINDASTMTIDNVDTKVAEVELILQKATEISSLRTYEDEVLGTTSTYFNETILAQINNANVQNLASIVEDSYINLAKEAVNQYATDHNVSVSDYEADKITQQGDEYRYNGQTYPTLTDALADALFADKQQVIIAEINNQKQTAIDSLSSTLTPAEKQELIDNINRVVLQYEGEITNANVLSTIERVPAIVEDALKIELEKSSQIEIIVNNTTEFAQNFDIPTDAVAEAKIEEDVYNKVTAIINQILADTTVSNIKIDANKVAAIYDEANDRKDLISEIETIKNRITDEELKNSVEAEATTIINRISGNNETMCSVTEGETAKNNFATHVDFVLKIDEAIVSVNAYAQTIEPTLSSSSQQDLADELAAQIAILRTAQDENELTTKLTAANTALALIKNKDTSNKQVEAAATLALADLAKVTGLANTDMVKYQNSIQAALTDVKTRINGSLTSADVTNFEDAYYQTLNDILTEAAALPTTRQTAITDINSAGGQFETDLANLSNLEPAVVANFIAQKDQIILDATNYINKTDATQIAEKVTNTTSLLNNLLAEATLANTLKELENAYNEAYPKLDYSPTAQEELTKTYQDATKLTDTSSISTVITTITELSQKADEVTTDFATLDAKYSSIIAKINALSDEIVKTEATKVLDEILETGKTAIIKDEATVADVETKLNRVELIVDRNKSVSDALEADVSINEDTKSRISIVIQNDALSFLTNNEEINNNSYIAEFDNLKGNIIMDTYGYPLTNTDRFVDNFRLNNSTYSNYEIIKAYAEIIVHFRVDTNTAIESVDITGYSADILTLITNAKNEAMANVNALADFDAIAQIYADYVAEVNSYLKPSADITDAVATTIAALEAIDDTKPVYKENASEIAQWLETLNGTYTNEEAVEIINQYNMMVKEQAALDAQIAELATLITKYQDNKLDDGSLVELATALSSEDLTVVNGAITSLQDKFDKTNSLAFAQLTTYIDSYPAEVKAQCEAIITNALNEAVSGDYNSVINQAIAAIDSISGVYTDYQNNLLTEAADLVQETIANLNSQTDYQYSSFDMANSIGSIEGNLATYQTEESGITFAIDNTTIFTDSKTNYDSFVIDNTNLELAALKEKALSSLENYSEAIGYSGDYTTQQGNIQGATSSSEVLINYETSLQDIDLLQEKEAILKQLEDYNNSVKDVLDTQASYDQAIININNASNSAEASQVVTEYKQTIETSTVEAGVVTDKVTEAIDKAKSQIDELDYLNDEEKEQYKEQLVVDTTSITTVEELLDKQAEITELVNTAIAENKTNSNLSTDDKNQIKANYVSDLTTIVDSITAENYPNLTADELAEAKNQVQAVIDNFNQTSTTDKVNAVYDAYDEATKQIDKIVAETADLNTNYETILAGEKQNAINEITQLINANPTIDFAEVSTSSITSSTTIAEVENAKAQIITQINDIIETDAIIKTNEKELQETADAAIIEISELTALSNQMKEDYAAKIEEALEAKKEKLQADQSQITQIKAELANDLAQIKSQATATNTLVTNLIAEYSDAKAYVDDNFANYIVDKTIYEQATKEIFDNAIYEITVSSLDNLDVIQTTVDEKLTALEDTAKNITNNETALKTAVQEATDLLNEKNISDEDKAAYSERITAQTAAIEALKNITDLAESATKISAITSELTTIKNEINTYELNSERAAAKETLTSLIQTSQSAIDTNALIPDFAKEILEAKLTEILNNLQERLANEGILTSLDLQDAIADIEAEVAYITKQAEAISSLVEKNNEIATELTNVPSISLTDTLNAKINDIIAATSETAFTGIETAYKQAVEDLLDSDYQQTINSLVDLPLSDLEEVLEQLDSMLDAYKLVDVEKANDYLNKLGTVIEGVTADVITNHDATQIEKVKEIVDKYNEYRNETTGSFTNYNDYLEAEVEKALEGEISSFETALAADNFDGCLTIFAGIEELINDYETVAEVFTLEQPVDYRDDISNIIEKAYTDLDFENTLKTDSLNAITAEIAKIEELNDLYNQTILSTSPNIYEDLIADTVVPTIEEVIVELTAEMIATPTITTAVKERLDNLVNVYQDNALTDVTKYDSYVKDQIVIQIEQARTDLETAILTTPQVGQIATSDQATIDKYFDLVTKYDNFADDEAYENTLKEDISEIIVLYGNRYLDRLISGSYTDDELTNYYLTTEYADLIYQATYADTTYDNSIQKGLINELNNTYEAIVSSGKYHSEEITKADEIYQTYANEMTNDDTSEAIVNTYYNCLAELNALPSSKIKAFGVLDDIRREMFNSQAYTEEDLARVDAIIAEYEEAVADNEVIYHVEAKCQEAEAKLLEILPYVEIVEKQLKADLAAIQASDLYFPEELALIEANYQTAFTSFVLTEEEIAENGLTIAPVTRVDEALETLNANNALIPTASEKGTSELNDYVANINKDDYSPLAYSQIKAYLNEGLAQITDGLIYQEVADITSSTISNIEALETLAEQSFTKVKADAIDMLEDLKGVNRNIDKAINTHLETINAIKPADGKTKVTEVLNEALADVLTKYQEYAKEELNEYVASLKEEDYNADEWKEIQDKVLEMEALIGGTTEIADTLALLEESKQIVSDIPTSLEVAKAEAIAKLDEYLEANEYLDTEIEEMKEQINNAASLEDVAILDAEFSETVTDLIAKNAEEELQAELTDAINDYLEAVNNNGNLTELEEAVEQLVKEYEDLADTNIEALEKYQEYCLTKAIVEATEELNNNYNGYYEIDYSAYNYQALTDIYNEALASFETAADEAEVSTILSDAIAQMAQVQNLSEESLDQTKENALSLLDQYADISGAITAIIENGKTAINNETDQDKINELCDQLINEIYLELVDQVLIDYPAADYYDGAYSEITAACNKAILDMKDNYSYNSCQQIYQEVLDKVNQVETKEQVDDRRITALEELIPYETEASDEINKIISDGTEALNNSKTIQAIENNLLNIINKLENQLLVEAIADSQEALTTEFNTIKQDYYSDENKATLQKIYDDAISALENCKIKENLEGINQQATTELANVETKMETLAATLEDMRTDSSEVSEIVDKWLAAVNGIIDNQDGTYTYPGTDITYDSLDELITYVEDTAISEIKAQNNLEIVNETTDLIKKYDTYLKNTDRFSEEGLSDITDVTTNALDDLALIDLTTDDVKDQCDSIYRQALADYSTILGDNTYTSDGKVNKNATDTALEYEDNHNFLEEGFYGNVATSDDILDLEIILVIEKQRKSSEEIVKETFVENKDQYDIYEEKQIDLEKSEIKELMDIYLIKDNKRYQVSGEVTYTVKILIPEEYRNTRELCIIHIKDDGTLEFYEVEFIGNYMVFETSHFSDYALIGMTYLEQTREEQIEEISETFEEFEQIAVEYNHDEWVAIRTIYEETLSRLDSKTITAPQMIEICLQAKTEIANVPTALEVAKTEAHKLLQAEFEKYLEDDYSNGNYQKIEDAYNAGKLAINEATTIDEVSTVLLNSTEQMAKPYSIAKIVWLIVIIILVILISTMLVLYFVYFKVNYYELTTEESPKLIKTRRIFWLFPVNPTKVEIEKAGYKVEGIYSDEECQVPSTKFRMPFGPVQLFVKLEKIVEKQKRKSKKPYVILSFDELGNPVEVVSEEVVDTKADSKTSTTSSSRSTSGSKKKTTSRTTSSSRSTSTSKKKTPSGSKKKDELVNQPETPKTKKRSTKPQAIKKVKEVQAENVNTLMSDEQLQIVNIKKEYERINPVIKGVINLDIISENFEAGDTIDLATLKAKKLVKGDITHIKILARGILNKPLIIKAHAYSKDAIKMIALTNGEIIIIERKK